MSPRDSLRYRLAVTIGALAFAVIVAFGIAAYVEIRASALQLAGERLDGVTRELAAMLGTSARGLRASAGVLGSDPDIAAYLRAPAPGRADAALSAMRRLAATPLTLIAVELWDGRGERVLSTSNAHPGSGPAATRQLTDLVSGPDSVVISGITTAPDSALYSVIARVGDNTSPLGYVVQHRRLANSAGATLELRRIIGSGARVLVGNTRGDLWTNFETRTAPPPIQPDSARGRTVYTRPGIGVVIASSAAISNTPWTLLVELPRADALRHLHAFMWELGLIGAFILLAAAVAGWAFSGTFARPMAELARAAEEISAGDYSRRVNASRDDEVGAVAHAFNRMTESITAARAALESKAAEAAASEHRLNSVIASSGAVLYELSIDDDPRVALEWISDNITSILGYTVAEATAPGWRSANVHPDDAARAGASGPTTLSRDGVREYRFRDAHGRYRWLRDDQRVLRDDASRRTKVVGALLDITEQRQLEEQLRQSQKLEAIGTLAGGIAHDFNNMLTVITSYVSMLLSGHHSDSDRADLEEISMAASRAAALTGKLLTFGRKAIVHVQPVDVNDIVHGMESMFRRLLLSDVELVTTLGSDISHVSADPSQLEQALMNLVVNASDAMPDGGLLVIETRDVELDDEYAQTHAHVTPGPYVMLAVTDTGVGMDDATRQKIFEPFFTTKDIGRGTGLGLATLYAIVKDLRGHVSVDSESGRGSVFKVYLPSVSLAVPSGDSASASARRWTGTALLVDDDVDVRRAVRRMLEKIGFTVLDAADGDDGLAVAAQHEGKMEVAVTDLMMPRMSGGEFAIALKKTHPELRVVFMSGYTDEAVLGAEFAGSGYTFVQKPFSDEQLAAAIGRLLNNGSGSQTH